MAPAPATRTASSAARCRRPRSSTPRTVAGSCCGRSRSGGMAASSCSSVTSPLSSRVSWRLERPTHELSVSRPFRASASRASPGRLNAMKSAGMYTDAAGMPSSAARCSSSISAPRLARGVANGSATSSIMPTSDSTAGLSSPIVATVSSTSRGGTNSSPTSTETAGKNHDSPPAARIRRSASGQLTPTSADACNGGPG